MHPGSERGGSHPGAHSIVTVDTRPYNWSALNICCSIAHKILPVTSKMGLSRGVPTQVLRSSRGGACGLRQGTQFPASASSGSRGPDADPAGSTRLQGRARALRVPTRSDRLCISDSRIPYSLNWNRCESRKIVSRERRGKESKTMPNSISSLQTTVQRPSIECNTPIRQPSRPLDSPSRHLQSPAGATG